MSRGGYSDDYDRGGRDRDDDDRGRGRDDDDRGRGRDDDYDRGRDDDYDRGRGRDDDFDRGRRPIRDVPNYLVQSIMCLLCCCWPAAIVAIIYAAQVNSKLAAGDTRGAIQASENAKMWCWISFGVGLPLTIIVAIVQFAAVQNHGF